MGWRSKKKDGPVFRAPPGYRDSGRPLFSTGEVVSSTYQVRELLHGDDHGQVFEAWDMLLERAVAIKVSWRDDDVPSLLPEARAPTAIGHECVADVYGLSNHRNSEYLVAERVPSVALAQHIAQIHDAGDKIPGSEALELLTKLTRGLAAVHAAGYALIRMSAANISITPEKRLVFSTFALGQGQLEAKPPVFAPEVITSRSAPEPGTEAAVACDLYSLGCVATELCTAASPFPGDTLKALRFAHVHHRPPQLAMMREDIPTELSDLVEELLAKSPEERPPSANDVARQLRTIAERASASRRIVRVLIVDDDPQRVRPLWSVLRRAHACTLVDAVVDVDEAGKKLEGDSPDVLILNLDLPGTMNGLEMCMYFRSLKGGKDCVLVAMSDNIKDEDAAVLEQVGVDRVLPHSARSHQSLTVLMRKLARGQVQA